MKLRSDASFLNGRKKWEECAVVAKLGMGRDTRDDGVRFRERRFVGSFARGKQIRALIIQDF